jgi:hypothetical protein
MRQLILSLCMASSAAFGQTRGSSPARDVDERAVQSIALDSIVADSHIRVVLLMQDAPALTFKPERPPEVSRAAWADFVAQSSQAKVLGTLSSKTRFEITTLSHASRPRRAAVTDTGVVTLSRVGFSPSGDEAVIYVDQSCGSRCGYSALETYRREGTRWVRKTRSITSMR